MQFSVACVLLELTHDSGVDMRMGAREESCERQAAQALWPAGGGPHRLLLRQLMV